MKSNGSRSVTQSFPARVAELGFTVPLPSDWIHHPLPDDDLDFSDPTKLVPLALVTAPHAAIIFTVASRPAYEDGSLFDWAGHLLAQNGLTPHALMPGQLGILSAVVGEAIQASELGPMVMRFAFAEDGRRIVNLSLSAPELLAAAVSPIWEQILSEFLLQNPLGPTVPLIPGGPIGTLPPKPEPTPVATRPETSPSLPATSTDPLSTSDSPAEPSFRDFALGEDASSLDPENPINANLRNRGVGFVPNVLAVDPATRQATVAAGAIVARFAVPFGWHVIDDGKRTLVLDPGSAVQINLSLLPREGRTAAELLDTIEEQMRRDYPQPVFARKQAGMIEALGARNIADGKQALEQYHMLMPHAGEGVFLRARVTSTPERSPGACDLALLILLSCESDPPQTEAVVSSPSEATTAAPSVEEADLSPSEKQMPAWWHRAVESE